MPSSKRSGPPVREGRIHFTPEARQQFQQLDEWIAKRVTPETARRFVLAILNHIDSILVYPFAAQIHLAKVKYKYLFWRPFTAITTGSVHQDPTWTPLEVTPQHPEYPSGHALQGGSQQAVLDALVGRSSPVPIAVTSSNFAGQSRTYTHWATINQEIINARVWEGVHFRNSDEVGSALGKQVTRYSLRHLHQIGL